MADVSSLLWDSAADMAPPPSGIVMHLPS
jgi:hypothetical protein